MLRVVMGARAAQRCKRRHSRFGAPVSRFEKESAGGLLSRIATCIGGCALRAQGAWRGGPGERLKQEGAGRAGSAVRHGTVAPRRRLEESRLSRSPSTPAAPTPYVAAGRGGRERGRKRFVARRYENGRLVATRGARGEEAGVEEDWKGNQGRLWALSRDGFGLAVGQLGVGRPMLPRGGPHFGRRLDPSPSCLSGVSASVFTPDSAAIRESATAEVRDRPAANRHPIFRVLQYLA